MDHLLRDDVDKLKNDLDTTKELTFRNMGTIVDRVADCVKKDTFDAHKTAVECRLDNIDSKIENAFTVQRKINASHTDVLQEIVKIYNGLHSYGFTGWVGTLGRTIAGALSYATNESLMWAAIHQDFGWQYVIYMGIKHRDVVVPFVLSLSKFFHQ